jgi:hypothetical protein
LGIENTTAGIDQVDFWTVATTARLVPEAMATRWYVEGSAVGLAIGELLGVLLGSVDGVLDGLLDGEPIRAAFGEVLVAEDGAADGLATGELLGSELRLVESFLEGALLGVLRGPALGPTDGDADGTSSGELLEARRWGRKILARRIFGRLVRWLARRLT